MRTDIGAAGDAVPEVTSQVSIPHSSTTTITVHALILLCWWGVIQTSPSHAEEAAAFEAAKRAKEAREAAEREAQEADARAAKAAEEVSSLMLQVCVHSM